MATESYTTTWDVTIKLTISPLKCKDFDGFAYLWLIDVTCIPGRHLIASIKGCPSSASILRGGL